MAIRTDAGSPLGGLPAGTGGGPTSPGPADVTRLPIVENLKGVVTFVLRSSKRIAVSAVGFALVLIGLIMFVTPGPGILVLIAGLAVLATEYAWARRALDSAKDRAARAKDAVTKKRWRRPPTTR